MAASLAALADLVGGRVIGDATVEVQRAVTLADAGPGDLTLVDRIEKAQKLAATGATAAVIPKGFTHTSLTMPAIEVDDLHQAFATIISHLRPARVRRRRGISPAAHVSPWARLDRDVEVHPLATIDDGAEIGSGSTIHSGVRIMADCKIGRNVTVYPGAVLYENTIVGDRTIIHANVVLGCHGFGFRFADGRHEPAAQLGYVQVGCDVEIGASSAVDRGTYGPTTVGDGTKIDNLVMIAHNCRIGRHNLICSQVGIAGSSSTGDYVVMAGQVGVKDHVHIGDGAVLGAMSGVTNDVPAGSQMFGIPATPAREQKIRLANVAKLPELRKQIKTLQHTVDVLAESHGLHNTPLGAHQPHDASDNQAAA